MRKRSKKIAALGITVAMVAMNLAACGGDSSNNGSQHPLPHRQAVQNRAASLQQKALPAQR